MTDIYNAEIQPDLQASRFLSGPNPHTCPELVEGSLRTVQSFVKELAKPTHQDRHDMTTNNHDRKEGRRHGSTPLELDKYLYK